MAVLLSPVGGVAAQFFTNAGVPLSGGKFYTYAAGTSTPQATYTTGAGNIQHSNPIVLDAAGRVPTGEIWLTDGLSYKFVLKDANDVLIATYDNIVGINSNFVNYVNQQEIQTATAGQTVFTLTTMQYQPGTGNLSVFVDGVNQYGPGAQYAYTETSSTVVTFVSGLHVGASVKFTTTEIQNSGVADASQITYTYPAVGAVEESVQDRLAQYVSVKDFGAVGDGVTDDYDAIEAAWNYCYPLGISLHFPCGTYVVQTKNFPFRNPSNASLLDCHNMTIFGDGPSTILKTVSVDGADVLQLNCLKNFHVKNLSITATISGTASGSNGISVTNGFDNLTFTGLNIYDLPYVDKASYLDGGKAITLQSTEYTNDFGTLTADYIAYNCVYGFDTDVDSVQWATKDHAITINGVFKKCFRGVTIGSAAASGMLSDGMTFGIVVNSQTVNCQQDVFLARVHGVTINNNIVTNEGITDLRKNANGTTWNSIDSIVCGLTATYAKDSKLNITGDKGNCDYKIQIGGIYQSGGNIGESDNVYLYADIGGVGATSDVNIIDFGGNSISNSVLYFSTTTTSSISSSALYNVVNSNTVTIGPSNVFTTVKTHTFQVLNNSNVDVFHINSDGTISTTGRNTANSVSTVKQVMPIYDVANVLVGYVPIYTTYA